MIRSSDETATYFNAWLVRTYSDDPWIREDAAQRVPEEPRAEVQKRLMCLLLDAEHLVRTAAIESMELFPCDEVRDVLRRTIEAEQSDLVRGAALETLASMAKAGDIQYIQSKLFSSGSEEQTAWAARALATAARRVAVDSLESVLSSSRNPEVLLVAVNSLLVISGPCLLDSIISSLKSLESRERRELVHSRILEVMAIIDKYCDPRDEEDEQKRRRE